MAAPNLAAATVTLYKKSVGHALTNTLTTDILANAASSGLVKVLKSIVVTNVDGTNSVNVSFEVQKGGSTAYRFASAIPLPAGAVITFDVSGIVLEENDKLRGGASANGDAEAVVSYDEYSN